MTLLYNLYYGEEPKIKVFPKSELVDKLSTLDKDEVYGYYCQHHYENNSLINANKKLKKRNFLKGKD